MADIPANSSETHEVKSIRLYAPLEDLQHPEKWLFAVLTLGCSAAAAAAINAGVGIKLSLQVALGVVAVVQALIKLCAVWSVDFRCALRFRAVASVEEAGFVKVTPHAFSGSKELVPLERREMASFHFRECF